MHGLGNDFMVVDLVTQHFDLTPEHVRSWADRKTGVGFDQLLVIAPPADPSADFRYLIYNADGSQAEQCGNGARCFAKYVADHQLSVKSQLTLETTSGFIQTEMLDADNVQVDMGVPCTEPERVPFETATPALSYQLAMGTETVDVTPVSVGNPHAVIFVADITSAPVEEVGTAVQQSGRFPQGVNVGFLQVIDQGFGRLRVFERGVGETRACGSGACAAMVAGQLHGRLQHRAKLSLPGGKLRLWWQGPNSPVRMAGSAVLVFEGQINV